jgi:hypothetical protein
VTDQLSRLASSAAQQFGNDWYLHVEEDSGFLTTGTAAEDNEPGFRLHVMVEGKRCAQFTDEQLWQGQVDVVFHAAASSTHPHAQNEHTAGSNGQPGVVSLSSSSSSSDRRGSSGCGDSGGASRNESGSYSPGLNAISVPLKRRVAKKSSSPEVRAMLVPLISQASLARLHASALDLWKAISIDSIDQPCSTVSPQQDWMRNLHQELDLDLEEDLQQTAAQRKRQQQGHATRAVQSKQQRSEERLHAASEAISSGAPRRLVLHFAQLLQEVGWWIYSSCSW